MGGAGVVIGAVLGLVASVLTRQVDDRLVEVAITFVLAYGSFLIADHLHASGVLACVASGVVMGSFGSRYGMSANTRVAVGDFWEFMAFFANSFVFLLVGIELDIPELLGHGGLILLVFLAVLFGRLVSVYTMLPLARWMKAEALLPGWAKALVWGGLRGSLSMVLVISLPESYPNRRFLLLLVFGVVSLSLFVQGLSIKPLLTRLGLRVDRRPRLDYERARAVTLMAACASQELRRLSDQGALFPRVGERLVHYYGDRQRLGAERAASLAGDALEADSLQEAALHLLAIEEDALRHAIADGVVSDEAASGLFQDLARRREALRHTESHPEVLEDLLRRVDGA
jgi:CPA1 family monovalent cation:H+ antiporter